MSATSVDLKKEIEDLHTLGTWQDRGKSAKRLNDFQNFRVSLLALKAGASLGEHRNPGRVSIQTVAGHTRIIAGGQTFDAPVGKVVFLDANVPHDVEALEDSAFLVSVALEGVNGRS